MLHSPQLATPFQSSVCPAKQVLVANLNRAMSLAKGDLAVCPKVLVLRKYNQSRQIRPILGLLSLKSQLSRKTTSWSHSFLIAQSGKYVNLAFRQTVIRLLTILLALLVSQVSMVWLTIDKVSCFVSFHYLNRAASAYSSALKSSLSRYPVGLMDDKQVLLATKNPFLGFDAHNYFPSKFQGSPSMSGYRKQQGKVGGHMWWWIPLESIRTRLLNGKCRTGRLEGWVISQTNWEKSLLTLGSFSCHFTMYYFILDLASDFYTKGPSLDQKQDTLQSSYPFTLMESSTLRILIHLQVSSLKYLIPVVYICSTFVRSTKIPEKAQATLWLLPLIRRGIPGIVNEKNDSPLMLISTGQNRSTGQFLVQMMLTSRGLPDCVYDPERANTVFFLNVVTSGQRQSLYIRVQRESRYQLEQSLSSLSLSSLCIPSIQLLGL